MAPILPIALLMLGSAQAAPDPPSPPSAPQPAPAASTQDANGLKDGTSYTVLSSQNRRDQAARCGMDVHGAAIDGVYLVELRHYEAWRNGVFVRTWEETAKTFLQCAGH